MISIFALVLLPSLAVADGEEARSPLAGTYSQVSVGTEHTCALDEAGAVTCWGNDAFGQATPPRGELFTQIACGGTFSCGLREDGSVLCWGYGGWQPQPSAYAGRYPDPRAGPHRQLAAAGGAVAALGEGGALQTERLERIPGAKSLALGPRHGCVLRDDGEIVCWGFRTDGQTSPPQGPFRAVAVGDRHGCSLRTDGSVDCWGADDAGQSSAPEGTYTALALGGERSCALQADGRIRCWGLAWSDAPPGGEFEEMVVGPGHGCAWSAAGAVSCWGADGWGQVSGRSVALTEQLTEDHGVWRDARIETLRGDAWDTLGTYTQVRVGHEHSCALRADGEIVCWGRNAVGQCDPPQGPFIDVALWDARTCGLHPDGTLQCWPAFEPLQMYSRDPKWSTWTKGDGRYASLLDTTEPCALRLDGGIECINVLWNGVPGPADVVDLDGPLASATMTAGGFVAMRGQGGPGSLSGHGFVSADLTSRTPCGIRADGSLSCFTRDIAELDVPEGRYLDVTHLSRDGVALREDGRIVVWSWSHDPRARTRELVLEEGPEGNFVQLDCGSAHCCAVDRNGSVECWGKDDWGQSSPLDGGFDEEKRRRWRAETVNALLREERDGSWRANVSGDWGLYGGNRRDDLLEVFRAHPELEGTVTARFTIGIDGRRGELEWSTDTPREYHLQGHFVREWHLREGEEPVPVTCFWTVDASAPTYEFGCRIEFLSGVVEFEEVLEWAPER